MLVDWYSIIHIEVALNVHNGTQTQAKTDVRSVQQEEVKKCSGHNAIGKFSLEVKIMNKRVSNICNPTVSSQWRGFAYRNSCAVMLFRERGWKVICREFNHYVNHHTSKEQMKVNVPTNSNRSGSRGDKKGPQLQKAVLMSCMARPSLMKSSFKDTQALSYLNGL